MVIQSCHLPACRREDQTMADRSVVAKANNQQAHIYIKNNLIDTKLFYFFDKYHAIGS